MTELRLKNLLLVGIDVTPLEYSAKKAGYKVYTVDYFGDQDLRSVSDDSFSVIEQKEGSSCGQLDVAFDAESLLEGAKRISSRNRIDAILLSTGLDDSPQVIAELSKIARIVGNSSGLIQKVRDKKRFFREIKRLGAPIPETAVVDDFSEATRASKDIRYPVLIKPLRGFGGVGIRKVGSAGELKDVFAKLSLSCQRVLIQEYIPGIAASASVVSSGEKSFTLTVNEQLIGSSFFGQREPFGYCGNIVPLYASEKLLSKCGKLAEEVITHFGLVGSNGVDFVISSDDVPYIVEVNPRFQGTLECIEKVLGINMVEAHIRACTKGLLPKRKHTVSRFCTRLILYALHRSVVPDLSVYPEVRDIPFPGVVIERGEPVCSIIAEGKDRDSTLRKAGDAAENILSTLKEIH
jgi:predicted ATP-grasp superfamily ATP-dependent carboligase